MIIKLCWIHLYIVSFLYSSFEGTHFSIAFNVVPLLYLLFQVLSVCFRVINL